MSDHAGSAPSAGIGATEGRDGAGFSKSALGRLLALVAFLALASVAGEARAFAEVRGAESETAGMGPDGSVDPDATRWTGPRASDAGHALRVHETGESESEGESSSQAAFGFDADSNLAPPYGRLDRRVERASDLRRTSARRNAPRAPPAFAR